MFRPHASPRPGHPAGAHVRRHLSRLTAALLVVVLAMQLTSAGVAYADSAALAAPPPPEPVSLDQVIDNIRVWLVGILATVATLFLTWGFLRYTTSGGEAEEIAKAKRALRGAAIGYLGALLAPLLVGIVAGWVS